ncbi:myeloid cell surface antigen CD33-like [Emydura macquarii macquarii]|uniref:myeloid cell surface antigen CD33-like n=1 Tax=Emydura macquarii macquarii TaxID=1129001 RepID=UPI00352BC564
MPPWQDAGEQEIIAQGPSRRTGGANPAAAMLRVLLLALLWRGSLAQVPGYSLTVPSSVSVQEGLCVLVPCNFTYPASEANKNPQDKLYGHWFKGSANVGWDPPVASSDPSRGVSQETRGRFRLMGDPACGDCSLQIDDTRHTDAGSYFLRVERGTFKYSYCNSSNYTELWISVLRLTEEPEIQISPARRLPKMLVAGEPVTVTCTAPGRCSGTPPQISWTGPFSDTARDVSVSPANGTRAHSSELRFTPTRGDDGKNLTCTVTYSPAPGPSTSRAVGLQVGFAEEPARLLGLGVACGLGVAVGCCLLGCCVVKLWSRGPAPPSAVAKETANGTQGEQPADDAGLIYSNISNLPMDGTTLAARRTKGIQDGAAAAQDPSGPGELAEPHYASIDFSMDQHKGKQPLQEPAMEYSEIRMK